MTSHQGGVPSHFGRFFTNLAQDKHSVDQLLGLLDIAVGKVEFASLDEVQQTYKSLKSDLTAPVEEVSKEQFLQFICETYLLKGLVELTEENMVLLRDRCKRLQNSQTCSNQSNEREDHWSRPDVHCLKRKFNQIGDSIDSEEPPPKHLRESKDSQDMVDDTVAAHSLPEKLMQSLICRKVNLSRVTKGYVWWNKLNSVEVQPGCRLVLQEHSNRGLGYPVLKAWFSQTNLRIMLRSVVILEGSNLGEMQQYFELLRVYLTRYASEKMIHEDILEVLGQKKQVSYIKNISRVFKLLVIPNNTPICWREDHNSLKRGEQISVMRIRAAIPYCHHAIYIGDNQVIHYTGDDQASAYVQQSSLDEFFGDSKLFMVHKYDWELSSESTIQVARSLESVGQYHLLFSNCEHFATFCKTGCHMSLQATFSPSSHSRMVPQQNVVSTTFNSMKDMIKNNLMKLISVTAKESPSHQAISSSVESVLDSVKTWIPPLDYQAVKRAIELPDESVITSILKGSTTAFVILMVVGMIIEIGFFCYEMYTHASNLDREFVIFKFSQRLTSFLGASVAHMVTGLIVSLITGLFWPSASTAAVITVSLIIGGIAAIVTHFVVMNTCDAVRSHWHGNIADYKRIHLDLNQN